MEYTCTTKNVRQLFSEKLVCCQQRHQFCRQIGPLWDFSERECVSTSHLIGRRPRDVTLPSSDCLTKRLLKTPWRQKLGLSKALVVTTMWSHYWKFVSIKFPHAFNKR